MFVCAHKMRDDRQLCVFVIHCWEFLVDSRSFRYHGQLHEPYFFNCSTHTRIGEVAKQILVNLQWIGHVGLIILFAVNFSYGRPLWWRFGETCYIGDPWGYVTSLFGDDMSNSTALPVSVRGGGVETMSVLVSNHPISVRDKSICRKGRSPTFLCVVPHKTW